ncbi:RNA polymerase sigma factor [Carboxylicivirga sp. M1479]|uniref:RNA polymerase sigma factor n=1 Tax=Carboxylicivirga sp. M1479 TaxID=2594476 RepID=UPI0011774A72|nr:sigma-70 family RNA polymerase sigma factor [Carboxylicivirga sp. M1479]TRX70850.1 sigma-70 family RNA polymerase sigma factor [Carboxylicivirga sp. M1479]
MRIKKPKNTDKSDNQLLNQFQETGNIDLLGVLFERYMHLVYGVCLKYLKNRDDAQDCVIEVYEKLGKELLSKQVDNFKPWLYVVSKNQCLMRLRSQQARLKQERAYKKNEQALMELNPFVHPDYNTWEPEEMDERLEDCLNKLREHQRACVELFYYKELCYQTISEQLNIDIKKVKSYIQNGKRNLKICIEAHNE